MFDRIHWSPQDLDLEVFHNIVNDNELAGCVRELIFDGSQFSIGVTKRQYFNNFYWQVLDLFDDQRLEDPPLDSDDSEINILVNAIRYDYNVVDSDEACKSLFTLYGECKVMNEGYQKWKSSAQKQEQRMNDPRVLQEFSHALLKLSMYDNPLEPDGRA